MHFVNQKFPSKGQDAFPVAAQKLAYLFEEGMALLSISRSGAYRALNAGLVKTYTHGRRRYITHEALMEFRDQMQRQGGAA